MGGLTCGWHMDKSRSALAVEAAGAMAIVVGVALVSLAAAFIIGGVALVAFGVASEMGDR